MTEIEIFVKTIKEIMEKRGINKMKLAENSGLAYKTICDILSCKRKEVRFETIIRLSIGLGLRPGQLFDMAFNKKTPE